jgi:predicted alpha/beta superfamily hydrolase
MVTEIVRNMAWFGGTTDAIIVGIGYPDEREPHETLRTTIARRFYDLSPVRDETFEKVGELLECPVPTGGASDFLNFIKNELIPAIEEDFRADPDKRILAGHSLGGTFTAFALLEEPELFDTYIIGSPALSYGSRFIFKAEELFAKRQKKLTARVHLWVGEREETTNDPGLSDVIRFGAILESHKYRGLTLIKQVFPDLAHSEVIAPGFQAGLKFALKKRARK